MSHKYHRWSEAELKFVRDNAGRLNDEQMAAALTRITGRYVTLMGARKARHRAGIRKRPGSGKCEIRLPEPSGS